MLNPFFYATGITCDLSNLKTHVNRLPKENNWEDIDDLPAISPSADGPIEIKYVETFQSIRPYDVRVVHIFITEGSCYDKAGFLSPSPNQIRYILPPSSFEIIEHKFSNDVIEIVNLVRLGAFPVADVACCSWANECSYPERIYQFLEFVIAYNGTVRFSDFSLRLAKPFLHKIDMPFTFKLNNDLNGKYKLRFNNQELLDTRLNDLCLLSRLAPSGTIDIYATRDTRRMIIDHLPPYAKILMTLETLSPSPCYVLLERPYKNGRVILFSCHFSEIFNINHLDRYIVADEITRIQGKTAADQFLRDAEAKDLLETSVILISSSTSSPVIDTIEDELVDKLYDLCSIDKGEKALTEKTTDMFGNVLSGESDYINSIPKRAIFRFFPSTIEKPYDEIERKLYVQPDLSFALVSMNVETLLSDKNSRHLSAFDLTKYELVYEHLKQPNVDLDLHWLEILCVNKANRYSGIGKKFVLSIFEEIKSLSSPSVIGLDIPRTANYRLNKQLKLFYEKIGFNIHPIGNGNAVGFIII